MRDQGPTLTELSSDQIWLIKIIKAIVPPLFLSALQLSASLHIHINTKKHTPLWAHTHIHKIIARKKLTSEVGKHLFLESIWGEQNYREAKKGRRKRLKITCPFSKLPILIWSFLFKCAGNRTVGDKDGRPNRRAPSDPMSVAPVTSSCAFLLSRSASSDFKDS